MDERDVSHCFYLLFFFQGLRPQQRGPRAVCRVFLLQASEASRHTRSKKPQFSLVPFASLQVLRCAPLPYPGCTRSAMPVIMCVHRHDTCAAAHVPR